MTSTPTKITAAPSPLRRLLPGAPAGREARGSTLLRHLAVAVFARLVETELRFGLRNPIVQLITNKYSKLLRVRVRAWSLGAIVPLSTLVSSLLLSGMLREGAREWIPFVGGICAVGYFASAFGLLSSFTEGKSPTASGGSCGRPSATRP